MKSLETRHPRGRLLLALTIAALLASSGGAPALAQAQPPKVDPSVEFFDKGMIPELKIFVSKDQEAKLRANQRQYVECTFTENGKQQYKGRIKLKGAAGSFRNYDDRPALTLNLGKTAKDAQQSNKFHGLDKFHLNNSVQDESLMSELVCAHICRAAGYPAARVTHARVWINDRDVGLYVLKEGFDDKFIERNFLGSKGKGNLYDGGFCQDIDANLERDEGEGDDDKADLKALIAACREGDPQKRQALIAERLDVDAFLKFVALELMMSHWDGYAQSRNNYRVYFRWDNKKAVFFPHGMDQMFGDPNFSVFHVPGPIVTSAVLNVPDWKIRYREHVRALLPHFAPEKLHAVIDAAITRLTPVAAAIHPDRAKHVEARAKDFRNRLNDRQKNIVAQFPPEPIPFNAQGFALVEYWAPKPEGDAKLETKQAEGKKCLSFETGPSNRCVASFRSKIRLGRGSYRFEARVKPTGVVPLAEGGPGGLGLRISGGTRENSAFGATDWQTVSHPIEVAEELREMELVVELKCSAGSALVDQSSLRIVRAR